jgi:hypothetical protein
VCRAIGTLRWRRCGIFKEHLVQGTNHSSWQDWSYSVPMELLTILQNYVCYTSLVVFDFILPSAIQFIFSSISISVFYVVSNRKKYLILIMNKWIGSHNRKPKGGQVSWSLESSVLGCFSANHTDLFSYAFSPFSGAQKQNNWFSRGWERKWEVTH